MQTKLKPLFTKSLKTLLGLSALSVLSQGVLADAAIHFGNKIPGQNGEKIHNVLYIKNGMINFSADESKTKGADSNYSLFDSKGERVVHINPSQQQYMVMDKPTITAQVSKMKQAMDQMRAEMEQRLKDMPADQQKMMKKMMEVQGLGPAPAKPLKTHVELGKTDTIEGIKCRLVELQEQGKKIEQLCVADIKDLGLSKQDSQTLEKMKSFMDFMSQSAREIAPAQASEPSIEGFPIRTISYSPEGQIVDIIELQILSTAAIDAAKVSIPKGYKLMKAPQMH